MGKYSIVKTIADALNNDSAIKEFLDGDLNIFLGENGENPLGEKDCPYCLIVPAVGFYDDESNNVNIDIDFGIINETITTENNITEYAGYTEIDALAELIKTAIEKAVNTGYIEKSEYAIDGSNYPLFQGGFSIKINLENFITED